MSRSRSAPPRTNVHRGQRPRLSVPYSSHPPRRKGRSTLRNVLALLLGLVVSVGAAVLLGSLLRLSLTTSVMIGALGIVVTVGVLVLAQRARRNDRSQ